VEQQVYAFEETLGARADPDRTAFRQALGRYPTGVTVVTARAGDGTPIGLTVNSFAAVSLDPPLILWSIGHDSTHASAFRAAEYFCVNVLAADQVKLARQFARADGDRFVDVALRTGIGEAPVFEHALSVFECGREAVHPGGDHAVLLGRVQRFATRPGTPLVFHESGFRGLSASGSDRP